MEREALQKTFRPRLGSPASGVVVTGGASGIGLASARALAAVGRPLTLWDLKTTEAKSRAEEIAAEFGVITLGLGVDVRDPAAIRDSAAATRGKLPSTGALVHCAGTVDTGSLEGINLGELGRWHRRASARHRPPPAGVLGGPAAATKLRDGRHRLDQRHARQRHEPDLFGRQGRPKLRSSPRRSAGAHPSAQLVWVTFWVTQKVPAR